MLLLSLQSMLQLECPHINVLSKMDLIESYGKLAFPLEFYTQLQDLDYIQLALAEDRSIPCRFQSLTKVLTDIVQDYGLVGFQTLCVDDPDAVLHLVKLIDKANGYVFGGLLENNSSIFETIQSQKNELSIRDVEESI